jgi:hypothetical protein
MLHLIEETCLPATQTPGTGAEFGITLDVLKSLQDCWVSRFDWKKEQREINR